MKLRGVSLFAVLIAVMIFSCTSAIAQPRLDQANLTFWDNVMVNGYSSSPYDQWVYYPNTNWINTWFYDHPLDYRKWKEYSLLMSANVQGTLPVFVEVAINYSTDVYSLTGSDLPPLPPLTPEDEAEWIGRYRVFAQDIAPVGWQYYEFQGRLPVPYNPEWVSIDVRPVVPYELNTIVELSFILWHNCIPEPTTLGLVMLSLAMQGCRRKC